MSQLARCVIDASVGVKLFMDEEFSDAAHALFAEAANNPEAQQYVPDLFFVECANVLWKSVVRYGCPRANAARDLADLFALSLVSIPTPTVTPAALAIAIDHTISVYDACYVATAALVQAPLVTADGRLVRQLSASEHQIHFLGDLER